MHMNSAPHLLQEDRPEFERILDEALRTASRRPGLSAVGHRLTVDELRTRALGATTAIAARAETEYRAFVRLRAELRRPGNAPSVLDGASTRTSRAAGAAGAAGVAGAGSTGSTGSTDSVSGADSGAAGGPSGGGSDGAAGAEGADGRTGGVFAGGEGLLAEASGAGLMAMVSVLVPVLAGTAAVIFLLLGYALHLVTPEPAAAGPIRTVGWIFAGLAAAAVLIAMAGLLLTALRNGSSAVRAPRGGGPPGRRPGAGGGAPLHDGGLAAEVDRAREAWRAALLERGVVPFLREALADPRGAGPEPSGQLTGEWATLGYSHPGFSSRPATEVFDQEETRPRYSSPDFSRPGHGLQESGRTESGRPERRPEGGRPDHEGPAAP